MLHKLRGRTFDEFRIDEEIVSGARTVTEADVVGFACFHTVDRDLLIVDLGIHYHNLIIR